jgi:hypothetical protein
MRAVSRSAGRKAARRPLCHSRARRFGVPARPCSSELLRRSRATRAGGFVTLQDGDEQGPGDDQQPGRQGRTRSHILRMQRGHSREHQHSRRRGTGLHQLPARPNSAYNRSDASSVYRPACRDKPARLAYAIISGINRPQIVNPRSHPDPNQSRRHDRSQPTAGITGASRVDQPEILTATPSTLKVTTWRHQSELSSTRLPRFDLSTDARRDAWIPMNAAQIGGRSRLSNGNGVHELHLVVDQLLRSRQALETPESLAQRRVRRQGLEPRTR